MSDTECSWEEFKKYASELTKKAREENETVLFRGQSSSDWRLETTLERSENTAEVADYFRMILRIKSEVEAYTSQKWDEEPSIYDLEPKLLSGYDSFSLTMSMGDFPHYSYMAFLRHHGFPSPLLDWSASSVVAAFFAFRTPPPTDHVAIFAFRERDASGVKEGGSGEPAIRRLGPYVAGPKRHLHNAHNIRSVRDGSSRAPPSTTTLVCAVLMIRKRSFNRTCSSNSFCPATNERRFLLSWLITI